jgi:hypothetical protein
LQWNRRLEYGCYGKQHYRKTNGNNELQRAVPGSYLPERSITISARYCTDTIGTNYQRE